MCDVVQCRLWEVRLRDNKRKTLDKSNSPAGSGLVSDVSLLAKQKGKPLPESRTALIVSSHARYIVWLRGLTVIVELGCPHLIVAALKLRLENPSYLEQHSHSSPRSSLLLWR
jgi:hypothetical protein